MDRLKILLVLWDTRKTFKIQDDWADQILTITGRFGRTISEHCRNVGMEYAGEATYQSINDLIYEHTDLDYTHALVLGAGCVITNPERMCRGIYDQITNNPGMCLSGHLLHTGLWDSEKNPDFMTLHEQTMLISRHALEHMRQDGIIVNDDLEYETDNWHPFQRDERNVHDDYTPVNIWGDREREPIYIKKNGRMGVAEELINYCMGRTWHIQNLNTDMRQSKKYSYHVDQSEEFFELLNMNPRVVGANANRGHREFFDRFDFSNKIWLFNTEITCENLAQKPYNAFVGVAAGFLGWEYVSRYDFQPNSEIVFVDIDNNSLKFQKWFFKNYDHTVEQEWYDIVDQYVREEIFDMAERTQITGNKELTSELWRNARDVINAKWPEIKEYRVRFIHDDMITGDIVRDVVRKYSDPMVWFSNIFRYIGQIEKSYDYYDMQNFLNDLVDANRNVQWIGDSINVGSTTAMNSKPLVNDSFFRPVSIPKMPVEEIMAEIAGLEERDMFTDHRGNGHPGWSSFVLHGLGYDKTLGYEYYGYKNDQEAPYDWTPEALELTPTLVKYFQDAEFRKRYHRVRIMRLAPGGYINMHDDDPQRARNQWVQNIAINNPDNCEMHFWDSDFRYLGRVPWCDGSSFAIRIHYPHMVMNNSDVIRYHMITHGEN